MGDTEKLGEAIDSVENILYALEVGMPPAFHIQQVKTLLPEILIKLKEGFVEATGENPWI